MLMLTRLSGIELQIGTSVSFSYDDSLNIVVGVSWLWSLGHPLTCSLGSSVTSQSHHQHIFVMGKGKPGSFIPLARRGRIINHGDGRYLPEAPPLLPFPESSMWVTVILSGD